MTDDDKPIEVRIALIENDISYIKSKLDTLDFRASFEKQGERIGAAEKELAVIKAKLATLTWCLGIIGSTSIASLTAAILRFVFNS